MGGVEPSAIPPKVRVAICVSHPIPYFCALYAELASNPDLDIEVLFSVRAGAVPYADSEFGTVIDSGLGSLLSQFRHRFLLTRTSPDDESSVSYQGVASALHAIDPAVIVIYGFNRRISRYAMVWSRRHGRRLAYISDSEERGLRSTGRVASALKRIAGALVLRGADAVLAVGDANEAFYRRRWVPDERIARVPFPIDRTAFDPRSPRSRQRAELIKDTFGLGGQLIVLSSGKLVPRKRQRDIIAALGQSVHRVNVSLVLLGDGEDRHALQDLARRLGVNLLITGFTAPDDLPPWYLLADVYAHVSDFDPHPLAVSEAVYSGLPVVLSDRTGSWGPTDDVVPGVNGLVVPTGDIAAITVALDSLLGDATKRAAMAAAARHRGESLQESAFSGFAAKMVALRDPSTPSWRSPSRRSSAS